MAACEQGFGVWKEEGKARGGGVYIICADAACVRM